MENGKLKLGIKVSTVLTCGEDTERCSSSFFTRSEGKCSKELLVGAGPGCR